MKYVVITNPNNKYFVANPAAIEGGTKWRLSISEAIADLSNPSCYCLDHTVFQYLNISDSGKYYIAPNDYYEIHSIIDSDINPELFI